MNYWIVICILLFIGTTVALVWIGKKYLGDWLNYQAYVRDSYYHNQLVGHPFPCISLQTSQGDTLQTNFSSKKGGLILIFEPMSCQRCLELLLNTLQHIQSNMKDTAEFSIYGIAIDTPRTVLSNYRRVFKIKYQLGVPLQENILPTRLVNSTPIVFLVDSNNTILQAHNPTIGREQFSALFFYSLVFNHLPFLEVSIEGFDDSPLGKLKGGSILEIIKGNYDRDSLFW
ncbi:MAG: hypothetical protein F4X75_26385 [Gemmatimonadetes bacterium]|nr:hypothetical protein [Gemmatimonadota bacterium]